MWFAALILAAHAGALDAEVGVDTLHATSRSSEPASGPEETLSATEIGIRVRAHLSELDDRLQVDVDYRGTQPVAGTFREASHHLLYAAEVQYVEDVFTVGLGRFLAPSVLLLPVDGLRGSVEVGPVTLSAFSGRRAISTSRRNLGGFLAAVGGSAHLITDHADAEVLATYALDRIEVADHSENLPAASVAARGTFFPADGWVAGGQLTFAQRASYTWGPTWGDFSLQAEALDFWNALAWGQWSPRDDLRVGYDVHAQRASVFRAGWAGPDGVDPTPVAPNFLDNRARVAWAPMELGWLRGDVRWRVRPDRHEWRVGLDADVDALPAGLFVRGRIAVEDHTRSDDPKLARAVDRLLYKAAVGYHDHGVDVELGASFVERAANPVSGRVGDPVQPTTSDDLAPFVLEAQEIAFLRAFYADRNWFAGLDLEQSLRDREVRVMVQVGALGAVQW